MPIKSSLLEGVTERKRKFLENVWFFLQKNYIVIVNDFFLRNIGKVQGAESVFGPTVPLMDISYCFSRFFPSMLHNRWENDIHY